MQLKIDAWVSALPDDGLRPVRDAVQLLKTSGAPGIHADEMLARVALEFTFRKDRFQDACAACFPDGFDLRYANRAEYHRACECHIDDEIPLINPFTAS